MTAQICDIYKHSQTEYEIVKVTDMLTFDPRKYGITPECAITCCGNGFWCEYTTVDKHLTLENLFVCSKDDYYPQINGVNAEDEREFLEYLGHHAYFKVNLPISYTGKILVANGHMSDYTSPLGYRHVLGYQTILELAFEDGILNALSDQTETAQTIRDQIDRRMENLENTFFHRQRILYELYLKDKSAIWWL